MKARVSFTMVEVLIVIIILAILAGMSYPIYRKAIEHSRDKFAITNLKLILAGERLYRLNYNHYYPRPGGPITDLSQINDYLNLDLKEKYGYSYRIEVSADGKSFTAYALKDGKEKFRIDQDGNLVSIK